MQMAAEKTSEGTQGSSKVNKNVIKSKRRRFQDDDNESSQVDETLKEILARELSNFLDRTIEDVDICNREVGENNMKEREEQGNGFQLFSSSQQQTFSEEKQRVDEDETKSSSSSDDDDETTKRFQEAAISVDDLFGPEFNHHSKNSRKHKLMK